MERFAGKVAVVTGSSSGFGAAISKELVKQNLNVVGLARRLDKLQEICEEVENSEEYSGKFYPLKCDITNEEEIKNSFDWITKNLGPISILINNAGILQETSLCDVTSEHIDNSYNTNIKAVLLCTKEVVKDMIENSTDGHIININSVLGQVIVDADPNLYILYSSTKHALRVISEGLRKELIDKKTNIKVTNLSPGVGATNFNANNYFSTLPPGNLALQAEDVAKACVCVLNTPPSVVISELTLRPLHQKI